VGWQDSDQGKDPPATVGRWGKDGMWEGDQKCDGLELEARSASQGEVFYADPS
jgi:hypothetical protein